MKLLIHGYFGAGNAGDDALLQAMIDQFHAALPACEFVITVRSRKIRAYTGAAPVRTISGADIPALYEEIRACDAVVVGGGGLFQDYLGYRPCDLFNGGKGSINYYAVPLIMARLVGKPAMLYAVGIGPFQSEEARQAAHWIASSATVVTVRDRASADTLAAMGVAGAIQTADPALNLIAKAPAPKYLRTLPAKGNGPIIGVNLRHWAFDGATSAAFQAVSQVCRYLITKRGAWILVCPFNRSERELTLAHHLAKSIGGKRVRVLPYNQDPAILMWLCGRLDLMIAMRLHASILALGSGTPAIGLAYDPKVSQLFADAGLANWCVDAEQVDGSVLAERADALLARNQHWRRQVRASLAPLQKRERVNLQQLMAMLPL